MPRKKVKSVKISADTLLSATRRLSTMEKGDLLDCILDYLEDVEPIADGDVRTSYEYLKQEFDKQIQRSAERSEIYARNGSARWNKDGNSKGMQLQCNSTQKGCNSIQKVSNSIQKGCNCNAIAYQEKEKEREKEEIPLFPTTLFPIEEKDKEKEREKGLEKETKPKSPPPKSLDLSYVAPELKDIFLQWLDYKKERKQSYKPIGAKQCYSKLVNLSGGNPDMARRIVEESISNNYQGLFPVRNDNSTTTKLNQSKQVYEQF